MDANTTVWLVKPEPPNDADAVAAMRRAIEQDGTRAGTLAADCLGAARASGLSGEETYLFLAYEALLRLEETRQRHIYLNDTPHADAQTFEQHAVSHFAEQVGRQVGRLVRRVADLAVRTERVAAAHFTRTPVGRG
jgi:hypothetical protein